MTYYDSDVVLNNTLLDGEMFYVGKRLTAKRRRGHFRRHTFDGETAMGKTVTGKCPITVRYFHFNSKFNKSIIKKINNCVGDERRSFYGLIIYIVLRLFTCI